MDEKKELVKEEKKKKRRGGKLAKNSKFKGSKKDTFLSKIRNEPQSLKIRTYEEFMEDERRKKEKEEKEQKEKEKESVNGDDDDDDKEKDDALAEKKQLFNSMVAEDIENKK